MTTAADILHKYRLVVCLLVYAICVVLLYPFYQYIFDLDGIGYLMVTKRLAAGDYYNAINGYWSPLHSWLALPLYKAGVHEFLAFRVINAITGAGILFSVNRLLKKISVAPYLKTITLFVGIPIVLAYVFYELAADILLCLLLLIYTNLITSNSFFEKPSKQVACGFVGCLSYFAKAYAFPFFLLHFTIVQFFLYRNSLVNHRTQLLFRNLGLGFTTFLLLAAPWIYALYHKYHFVTFGYSGKLNHFWVLYPFEYTGGGQLQAISPAPLICHWEDPYSYPTNFRPHASFFSIPVIIQQIRVALTTFMNMLARFHEISFLSSALILCGIVYAVKKKHIVCSLMLLVTVILPAGYLLVRIETRFLWAATFLILITGIVLIGEAARRFSLHKRIQVAAWCIFFGSFLIYPVNLLKDIAGKQAEDFAVAKELNDNHVKGKFVCNTYEHMGETAIYAYLTGSTFYHLSRVPENYSELQAACNTSGINYFFFYYNEPAELDAFKQTNLYKNALQEIKTKKANLLLLKIN